MFAFRRGENDSLYVKVCVIFTGLLSLFVIISYNLPEHPFLPLHHPWLKLKSYPINSAQARNCNLTRKGGSGKENRLDACGCLRSAAVFQTIVNNYKFEATTCGREAFLRGGGQKVVSFSFYGNSKSEREIRRQYLKGKSGLQVFCGFRHYQIMV